MQLRFFVFLTFERICFDILKYGIIIQKFRQIITYNSEAGLAHNGLAGLARHVNLRECTLHLPSQKQIR